MSSTPGSPERPSRRSGRSGARRRRSRDSSVPGALKPAQVERRRLALPTITFPEDLPVSQRRHEIAAAIRDHQVVVIAGRDGLGQDHPDPEDLPGAGPRRDRSDRAHPAPPSGRAGGGDPDRRGARRRARRCGGLRRALHRSGVGHDAGQGHDRRHPAQRAPTRPRPARLRHDHHRRGPRTQPEHRLHPRLPGAAPAASARPQGDHHLGHDRPRALQRALRRGSDRRGVGTHVPRRDPLPPGGGGGRGRRRAPAAAPRRGPRSTRRHRRRRARALARAARRRAGVPLGGAGDPRCRGRAAQPRPGRHRDPAAVLPAHDGRAAEGLPGARGPAHRVGHQRGRDVDHGAGHPLRRRSRARPDLPLQHSAEGPAPPHRARLAGLGGAARRPLRTPVRRDLHPAVRRGGLRVAPCVHRTRDAAHQPGVGHPADGGDRPG